MTLLHKIGAWFALLRFTVSAHLAVRSLERRAGRGEDIRDEAARLDALLADAIARADTTWGVSADAEV